MMCGQRGSAKAICWPPVDAIRSWKSGNGLEVLSRNDGCLAVIINTKVFLNDSGTAPSMARKAASKFEAGVSTGTFRP